MAELVGDVLAVVLAVVLTGSVVMHFRVDPPWWRTGISRHLMAYMASFAAVMDLTALRILTGSSLDSPWFALLRLAVFATAPVVAIWRLLIQVQMHRQAREARGRREPPRLPFPPGRGPGRVFTMSMEDRAMTIFGREPALWLTLLTAVLGIAVSAGLTDAQGASLIIAAVTAAGGLVVAFTVKPFAPAAVTGLFGALVALGAHYGLHLSDGSVAAINTLLLAVVALLVRAQVTPRADPHPQFLAR